MFFSEKVPSFVVIFTPAFVVVQLDTLIVVLLWIANPPFVFMKIFFKSSSPVVVYWNRECFGILVCIN